MRSGITIAVLMSLATNTQAASQASFEGHGLGSGNGFPRVQVEQEQLTEIPDLALLKEAFSRIAAQVPTLAFRLNLLADRFGKESAYRFVHFKGDYPYQFANSESWPVLDEWGIPQQARITVWNDFYKLEPEKRVEVLLHETLHILVTGNHEEETQELTRALMQDRLTELSPGAGRLLQAAIQKVSEKATRIQDRQVLEYYLRSRNLPESCDDLKAQISVKIGDREFQFPDPADASIVRLRRDSALSRSLLVECLQKTPEGRTLVKGFFEHPYFRSQFIKAIVGSEPSVRKDGRGRVQADFVTAFSKRLSEGLRKVPVSELEQKLPGFSDWLRIQRELLGDEIPATPMVWDVSQMIRSIGDVLEGGTIAHVKAFRASSNISYNDWPNLTVE